MNYRAVLWLLGCVLLLLAAFLLVPAGISLAYGEGESVRACLMAALTAAVPGAGLWWLFRGATYRKHGGLDFFRREGLAVVGLAWFLSAAVGALPFLYAGVEVTAGQEIGLVDALFESASGFTTTGSTILHGDGIDGLPMGIAFWRSFTHWLGGIGIVLVFVVIFPTGGRSLFRSEVPGVAREAVQQRVRDSAMGLVKIYVGLTLLEIALLMPALRGSEELRVILTEKLGRAPDWGDYLYDAVVHSFGTLATGGFSTHSASIGVYGSWKVEAIVVVFMLAAGINFGMYDVLLRVGPRAGWRVFLRSPEFRVYAGMIVGLTAVLALTLWFWGGSNAQALPAAELQALEARWEAEGVEPLPDYSELSKAVRDASFNVISIQTSTGYGTEDFDRWPHFGRMLMMFIAFVGAMAGSTGGGLKIIRFLILAKASIRGLRRFSRPRAIHPIRVGDQPLDEGTVSLVMGYCGLWGVVFLGGTLFLAALNTEPVTAATAVLATLNNIGPGLNEVGPHGNFSGFVPAAKLMLTTFMIIGRLEFYAVAVLLSPRFWRH